MITRITVAFAIFLSMGQPSEAKPVAEPVDAGVELVRFDPVESLNLRPPTPARAAVWQALHKSVLPLQPSQIDSVAVSQKLQVLLGEDSFGGFLAQWSLAQHSLLARQERLVERGALILVGITLLTVIGLVFGIYRWLVSLRLRRQQEDDLIAYGHYRCPQRESLRREKLQEALGHLIAISDCLMLSSGPRGALDARRLISRPRLKLVAAQAQDTLDWIDAVHAAGQRLDFSNEAGRISFERFVDWSETLRDNDAATLGLRDLRKAAIDLNSALKQAPSAQQSVTLPLYELPDQRWRYDSIKIAS